VPIYYEGRPASLELSEAEPPKIAPDFEEVTEGEEAERKEGLKSRWAQLAAAMRKSDFYMAVDIAVDPSTVRPISE
jgi:hypothetical protein